MDADVCAAYWCGRNDRRRNIRAGATRENGVLPAGLQFACGEGQCAPAVANIFRDRNAGILR